MTIDLGNGFKIEPVKTTENVNRVIAFVRDCEHNCNLRNTRQPFYFRVSYEAAFDLEQTFPPTTRDVVNRIVFSAKDRVLMGYPCSVIPRDAVQPCEPIVLIFTTEKGLQTR